MSGKKIVCSASLRDCLTVFFFGGSAKISEMFDGPGSFLPMPGFIGEPQMALGKEWDLINSSHDIEYIKSTIQKKGINYFAMWGT